MADRFPSLEDFDSGAQPGLSPVSAEPSTDDFLAREKAILGDDAEQFATRNDSTVLADTGDIVTTAKSTFEAQFPDLAISQDFDASGLVSESGPSVQYNSGYPVQVQDEEEPEVIREWRERRDVANARRAEKFAQQREETTREAQQNIDDFYENYNVKKEKQIAVTRKEAEEFLASREDTVSGGTSWERIAKLVDLSGKNPKGGASGSGKERFRELLMSLRKDEKAPGASGY